MRCIEITGTFLSRVSAHRLIETWDVLKFIRKSRMVGTHGLIETWDVLKYPAPDVQLRLIGTINRNMRCIEIFCDLCLDCWHFGLIETWDVLKSVKPKFDTVIEFRINRNMRCIEIKQETTHRTVRNWWLIETWDVLKLIRCGYRGYGSGD